MCKLDVIVDGVHSCVKCGELCGEKYQSIQMCHQSNMSKREGNFLKESGFKVVHIYENR